MKKASAMDRALELAKSGECRSVSEILRRLPTHEQKAVEDHLIDHNARRELILLCSDAWLEAH